jgi:tetratricopeptide (TPR) repeat protein
MKRLFAALLLFSVLPSFAQNIAGGCSNFWLKADYSGLPQASEHKITATKQLAATNLHDTIKAKAYNTLAIAADLDNNHQQALQHYNTSYRYLERYPHLQVYVDVNKASAYEALTDYGKSLEIGNAALKKFKKSLTPQTTALLYNVLSVAFFRVDDIGKSAYYAVKGINILEKHKESCYLYLLKLSMANTYIQNNNYDFAITLFEDYLKNNTAASGTKVHTIALVNYSECFIALEKFGKARSILTEALPDVEKAGDSELVAVLNYRLANLEDRSGNMAASLAWYKKAYDLLKDKKSRFSTNIFSSYLTVLDKAGKFDEALSLAQSFKSTMSYKKGIALERYNYEVAVADIYKKNNKPQLAIAALSEAVRLSDSLRQTTNGIFERELQVKYQTKFEQEKNKLLQNELRAESHLLFLYVILSIGALVVVLLFLRSSRLGSRLDKERLKNMEADKLLAEQQRVHEQEVNQTQKLTLEEKEREVTSMALRLANYYDNINVLIDNCATGKYATGNDVKRELQQLVSQKDYWKQFETRFNNLNPDFALNLTSKFEKLTKNDIEFCTLLKLRLSNKEIASILQISHESVITKKYRIRKKMDVSGDEEFDQLLAII